VPGGPILDFGIAIPDRDMLILIIGIKVPGPDMLILIIRIAIPGHGTAIPDAGIRNSRLMDRNSRLMLYELIFMDVALERIDYDLFSLLSTCV
jgi:hypothetical protein